MNNNRKILISTPFLIALTILLLNDHILKTAYPGWLTGKLSDFAGLYVMAVFIYAVFGKYLRSGKSLLLLHIAIGQSFTIWKIAPVELLFEMINNFISIPLPARVKDTTDIIAVMILPLSYLYIRRFQSLRQLSVTMPVLKRVLTMILFVIAGFAITATYSGRRYEIRPNVEQKTYMEWPQIRKAFEQVLAENKVTIKNSHAVDDSTYLYKIEFTTEKKVESPKLEETAVQYVSILTLLYSPSAQSVGIKDIYGWVAKDMPDEKAIDKTYMNRIIEPFLKSLKY